MHFLISTEQTPPIAKSRAPPVSRIRYRRMISSENSMEPKNSKRSRSEKPKNIKRYISSATRRKFKQESEITATLRRAASLLLRGC